MYTRQSLYRSIPSGLISSHLRRLFPACLYLVGSFQSNYVESSFFHSCCQAFFNTRSYFPIHKYWAIPVPSIICTVKCCYRLNHFPSERAYPGHIFLRVGYTVQSRVQSVFIIQSLREPQSGGGSLWFCCWWELLVLPEKGEAHAIQVLWEIETSIIYFKDEENKKMTWHVAQIFRTKSLAGMVLDQINHNF